MSWAVTVEKSAAGCFMWMVSVKGGTLVYRTCVLSLDRVGGYSKGISSPSAFVVISHILIVVRFPPISSLLMVIFDGSIPKGFINQCASYLHSLLDSLWLHCCHHSSNLWSKAIDVPFNPFVLRGTTPTVVVLNDIPNITPNVVIDGIAILIPTIPLTSTLVAYLGYNSGKYILQLLCNDGEEVKNSVNTIIHLTTLTTYLATLTINPIITLPVCPVRPPVLSPRDAAVARPALRVVILGGIIYMREDI
nr:hypothetical protein [Tanacetum cinerariifolium]